MAGSSLWRPHQSLPEPWYEYFYNEAWLHFMMPHETMFDPYGTGSYNPEYLHAHH